MTWEAARDAVRNTEMRARIGVWLLRWRALISTSVLKLKKVAQHG
jgi:hypothetical protein